MPFAASLFTKADTVAHAFVDAQNFLLEGASSLARATYEAIPARAAPVSLEKQQTPKAEAPQEAPAIQENNAPITRTIVGQKLTPALSSLKHSSHMATDMPVREAAFILPEPSSRSHASMNATLMPSERKLGPDGLPLGGGFDQRTGITWGPYGKPYLGPRPY